MELPLLTRDQRACVDRYGRDYCKEIRVSICEGKTVFAGIPNHRFASKKTAQSSFGLNLKSWNIEIPKYKRNWYREITVAQYHTEFKNTPGQVGRKMKNLVEALLTRAVTQGQYRANLIIQNERKVAREQALEDERQRDREIRAMQIADWEAIKAAEWLSDPSGAAERQREARERKAMWFAEKRDKPRRDAERRQAERDAEAEEQRISKCPRLREQRELKKIEQQRELSRRAVEVLRAMKGLPANSR